MSDKQKLITTESRGLKGDLFDEMIAEFARPHCALVKKNLKVADSFQYNISFPFEGGANVVAMVLSLKHWQTDSDVVVNNIWTVPRTVRSGNPSKVVSYLIDWARENQLNEIRATQVNQEMYRAFWRKNGFTPPTGPDPYGDFIYRITA